jgi:hypothetical protein
MFRTLIIGSLLLFGLPLQARSEFTQEEVAPPKKETDPPSRIQQIESARTEKEATLQPEAAPKLQHNIRWLQNSFPYRLMTGDLHGFGLAVGGPGPGGGLAIGPQFALRGLRDGKLDIKSAALVSTTRSYLGFLKMSYRDLAGGHLTLNARAAQRSLTEMSYYGPGPDSEKSGRSDFRVDDTTVEVQPVLTFFRYLHIGGDAAYLKVNIGPGHSTRYISAERAYTPEQAVGIDLQTKFWRGGGFLEFDWRDRDWDPTSGGRYSGHYARYLDRDQDRFSFLRLDFDAAQYIPLFNHTRVIALHGATSLTKTNGTQFVPFYLQPTLGGAYSLRGYRSYRFYGNNSVLANAEYRWEISPTASLAAFADAGRVFDRWSQWNLHDAESDVGFGVAFRTETKVVFRIDTAFSHEGVQVWFHANNLF